MSKLDIKNIYLNYINKPWIKILVVLIISFVIVTSASKLYPAELFNNKTSEKEFTTHLDERIPVIMKDYDIPGTSIALVKNGELIWSKAYGYADLEKGRKMTTDTYCRVESISKSVTAWGIMKLVEQGKIELDKPVHLYFKNWEFPESEFSEEKITVRQLLSNSAGMPLGTIGVHYSPEEENIPSLKESLSKEAVLQQKPGLSFSYSNTGFNIIELLIEEVTGHDFAEYMKEEVLFPLEMHNSSFTWSEDFEPPVPVGYDLKGNPVPVYVYPDKASGGLFATVDDIATFVTAGMPNYYQTERKVLSASSINKLYQPVVEISGFYGLAFDSYGLGHFIEIINNNKKTVSHGGQGSGWMTYFKSVPETGDGIVILSNSQRSWPFFAYILRDWAAWRGFSSVGMGQIIRGQKIVWTFIGLMLFSVLWQVGRLGQGFVSGRRKFAPFSKKFLLFRLVQSIVFIILIAVLFWSINQDYLFISSVFPIASIWLGLSIFALAVAILLSAMFPRTEKR